MKKIKNNNECPVVEVVYVTPNNTPLIHSTESYSILQKHFLLKNKISLLDYELH
jgi:hypothetical protein